MCFYNNKLYFQDFSQVKLSGAEKFISEIQAEHLGEKTQRKTTMDLCQQGLEAGDNITKSESWSQGELSRNQIISKFNASYLRLYSYTYNQITETHY